MVPKSEAFAKANTLLTFFVSVTVGAVVLASILLFFFIKKMLKPFVAINEKLDVLASSEGDLTTRIPITTRDEFGEMSTKFNLMLENLQGLISGVLHKGDEVNHSSTLLLEQFDDMSVVSKEITATIQEAATLSENPELNNEELIGWVYDQFKESVELEIEWSNYVLKDIEGIDLDDMQGYIKYRANKMLRLIGLSEIYPEYVENPMKWIRAYADNIDGTKTDFFEQKSRQYVKVNAIDNGFDDL